MPNIRIETETQLYALLIAGYPDEEIRSRLRTSFQTIHKYRESVSSLIALNSMVRKTECPRCKSVVIILVTMASARCQECLSVFDLHFKADLRKDLSKDTDD